MAQCQRTNAVLPLQVEPGYVSAPSSTRSRVVLIVALRIIFAAVRNSLDAPVEGQLLNPRAQPIDLFVQRRRRRGHRRDRRRRLGDGRVARVR